ncbi:hypothetical protein BGZ79_008378 [Entomortierella chlamydospora]|nr:hypothetical protein BGZ79_008378 [Entomortierella chlamydospora]
MVLDTIFKWFGILRETIKLLSINIEYGGERLNFAKDKSKVVKVIEAVNVEVEGVDEKISANSKQAELLSSDTIKQVVQDPSSRENGAPPQLHFPARLAYCRSGGDALTRV